MNAINRILVPVDFSEYTNQVVRYAAELSRRYEAPLVLLHAWEPVNYLPPEGYITFTQEQLDRMLAELKVELDKVAATAKQAGAAGVDAVVVQGYPYTEIVRQVGQRQCDLIVMGTHGRTGLKHLLIGSVAENTVRNAP